MYSDNFPERTIGSVLTALQISLLIRAESLQPPNLNLKSSYANACTAWLVMTSVAGNSSIEVAAKAGFTVPSANNFRQIYYLFAYLELISL